MTPEVAVTAWAIRTASDISRDPSSTRGSGGRPLPGGASALVELAREVLSARRASSLPELSPELEVRLGTIRGSRESDLGFFQSLAERGESLGSPSVFVHTLSTSALAEMSIALGRRAPFATVSSGEASGLLAVALGAGSVASGRAAASLCGAMDVCGAESDVIALFLLEPVRPDIVVPRLGHWALSTESGGPSSPTSLRSSMERLVLALGSLDGGQVVARSATGESVRLSVVPAARSPGQTARAASVEWA